MLASFIGSLLFEEKGCPADEAFRNQLSARLPVSHCRR